jgi:CRP-like cAMP-binding protein
MGKRRDRVLAGAKVYSRRMGNQAWRESSVFRDLDDQQAAALAQLLRPVSLDPGAYLMREGEKADEMYFLQTGSLDVLKVEPGSGREHAIARIEAGQVIGEMALISGQPRAASVRARGPAMLLALSFEVLRPRAGTSQFGVLRDAYSKIINNVASTLTERLRDSDDVALQAAHMRLAMGQLTIYVFLIFAIYVLTLGCLPLLREYLPGESSYISVPLILIFGAMILHFMRSSGYPMETFGISKRNTGRFALEGVLYTLPILALATAGKWAFIHWNASYSGARLFDYRNVLENLGPTQFTVILVLYMVLTAVQELIVRGALQSALELFLVTPRRHLTAILVSNVLFSAVHMHISPALALLLFGPGLYWGWLYRRQRHLAGVIASHLLTGVYSFFVLGPLT